MIIIFLIAAFMAFYGLVYTAARFFDDTGKYHATIITICVFLLSILLAAKKILEYKEIGY